MPLICHVTVETTGTMLLGSEIGAALTALEPLGIDLIGLNCATGPAEMTEHLRYLSQHARVPLSVMPNAGLPELTADGARYPLTPDELAEALERFVTEYGVGLVGGCCGTTPEHIRRGGRARCTASTPAARAAAAVEPGVAVDLPPRAVRPGRQRADGGGADQRQRLQGVPRGDARRRLPGLRGDRPRARPGTARTCSTCASTTSAATAPHDMRELAGRFATASTLPIMLDSTEPAVIEAGLEMLGGRCVVNSVNFEDGDGPDSRYARVMPIVAEHGAAVVALTIDEEGQARTARVEGPGRRPADRRPDRPLGPATAPTS